jgi:hypothetical protein
MKTKNHQSTSTKESRLAKALALASSHEGCSAAAIQCTEVNTWGAMDVFNKRIIIDILEESECDVFRVHAPRWLPVPSAEAATAIANRANMKLMVANVVVQDNSLGIFAHQFIPKDGIPSEKNLKRLIDDVLIGIVLVLKQLEDIEQKSVLLEKLASCPEPILN